MSECDVMVLLVGANVFILGVIVLMLARILSLLEKPIRPPTTEEDWYNGI